MMVGKGKFWLVAVCMALVGQAAYGSSLDTVTLQLYGAQVGRRGAGRVWSQFRLSRRTGLHRGYALQIDTADRYSGTGANLVQLRQKSWRGRGYVLRRSLPGRPHLDDDLFDPQRERLGEHGRPLVGKDHHPSRTVRLFLARRGGQFVCSRPVDGGQNGWSNDSAAAFETCVWEIMNETSSTYGVSQGDGSFYMMGEPWTGTANTWLTELN